MDAYDRARALRDNEAAQNAGFATSETVYEVGTPVNATGVRNAGKFKRDFDAMLPTVRVCEQGKALIQGENRLFRPGIEATQLLMHPDGLLGAHGKSGAIALTPQGFTGLCRLITPGGADYLAACPPEKRADHVNYWLQRALTKSKGEPKKLSLWLRQQENNASKREVFGVFGKRYVPFGGDQILEIVMEEAPPGSKAIMKYDRYRGKIDVILNTDVKPQDCVAGEYFRVVLTVRWADDGSGAIQTESAYWRNLCLNFINLAKVKQKFGSARHTGNVENIRSIVQAAVKQATQSIEWFSTRWTESLKENVLDKYDPGNERGVRGLFEGLVYNKAVWMPGVSPSDQVARFMACWACDYNGGGAQRTDIINAVSRAAHEYAFESPWVQEELEETAGELLYNRVWNVYVPDEDRERMFGSHSNELP